jgi:hypothetical protein
MKRYILVLVAAAIVRAASPVAPNVEQTPSNIDHPSNGKTEAPRASRTAIFISNRIGPEMDRQMEAFEDLVTARVTDLGFRVVSKGISSDAMRKFDPTLASTPRSAESLDTQLSERSSALRIAQGLGADYLLVASMVSMGAKERRVDAYGLVATYTDTTLRFTYKLIEGQTGATITSDADKAVYSTRQTEHASEKSTDLTNELLDDAAAKIAASLGRKVSQGRITAPTAPAAAANLTINVQIADVTMPEIRIIENTVRVGPGQFKVVTSSAVVEIDGVAVGTAPGVVSVKPGFSKLRLTREGFKPWERTINVFNGQTLTVALEMSAETYARWKDLAGFLADLQNGAKLKEAEAQALILKATAVEKSGIQVDTKGASVLGWLVP